MDVNDICSNLPEKVRKLRPVYHCITESDTTSYPFQVEKVKPIKKGLKMNNIGLLQCFHNHNDKEMKPAEKFVQII